MKKVNEETTIRKVALTITGAFHSVGGIAVVNRLTILALSKRQCSIDIFVLNESDNRIDDRYINASNITYHVFDGNKIRFLSAIYKAVLTTEYDLLLCDHINIAAGFWLLSNLRVCRLCVWVHGREAFYPKPDWKGRIGFVSADKVICNSKYTYDKISKRFPEVTFRICELALDPVRHTISIPGEPFLPNCPFELQCVAGKRQIIGPDAIMHVGRMTIAEDYKGQRTLLSAFPAVMARRPDAQLLLIGTGDQIEIIRSIALSYPYEVQSHVFIPGYLDDNTLDTVYRKCKIFAMPSSGEGFGLVYIEAMSRAKACIGSRNDAASVVIDDQVTGVLVDDPRSMDELAYVLITLLEHPNQLIKMGQNGYDRVQNNFLFKHFEKRFWDAIYQ